MTDITGQTLEQILSDVGDSGVSQPTDLTLISREVLGTPVNYAMTVAELLNYNLGATDSINQLITTKLKQTIYAEDFGAKGDFVTDDTIKINNAFAESSIVEFEAGKTYYVTAQLVVKSGLTIIGNNATIYCNNLNLISILGTPFSATINNLTIRDLNLVGVGTWTVTPFANPAGGGNSVGFTSLTRGLFLPLTAGTNITIKNVSCTGVLEAIRVYSTTNLLIEGCYAKSCGSVGIRADLCSLARISNNGISTMLGNMTAAGDTNPLHSKFADGIYSGANTLTTIVGNTITNVIRIGIVLESAYTGAGVNSQVAINANSISNTNSHRDTELNAGIWAEPGKVGKSVTINGNAIDNSMVTSPSGLFGIRAYDGCVVVGNYVVGNNVGIQGDDLLISNNIIDGYTAATAHDSYGIATDGAATTLHRAEILGNYVTNCSIHGLYIDSASNACRVSVKNNHSYLNGRAGIYFPTTFRGNAVISGNTLEDNGQSITAGLTRAGIYIDAIPAPILPIVITGNTFISSMSPADTVGQFISVLYNNAQTTQTSQYILNNTFVFTSSSLAAYPNNMGVVPATYAVTNGASYAIYEILESRGNYSTKMPTPLAGNGIATDIYSSNYNTDGYYGQRYMGSLQNAPTTGSYQRGDYFTIGQPNSPGFMGVVCVASGSPGTWKFYGPVSS